MEQRKKYKPEQVTIVIPTYRRAEEVEKTLTAIQALNPKPGEVIIVDQSETDETKKICKQKKAKYLFSPIPSANIARNKGAEAARKQAKIIVFMDDDVTLDKGYIKNIVETFNKYPKVEAVSGFFNDEGVTEFSFRTKIEQNIKRFFFLGHVLEKDKQRLNSPYGNTGPLKLIKEIQTEWLCGTNIAVRRETTKKIKFDEHLLGYGIGDDIDLTYQIWGKNHEGLILTPFAKLVHRSARVGKKDIKKYSYLNQIDHFYLFSKHFNNTFKNRIKFIWALFGIFLLRTISLLSCTKEAIQKWWYFLISLVYSLLNWKKIKQGKVREFLKQ